MVARCWFGSVVCDRQESEIQLFQSEIQLFQNLSPVGHSGMLIYHVAGFVNQHDGASRCDTVSTSDFFAEGRQQIDSKDFCFTVQLFFDPVHDGRSRQSRSSGVFEEFQQRWTTRADFGLEFRHRFQFGCFVA